MKLLTLHLWDGSSCGSTSHNRGVADTSTTAGNQTATSEENVCRKRWIKCAKSHQTQIRRFEDCDSLDDYDDESTKAAR